MDARYLRNVPALSAEECEVLATKRVLVVGCGGLGGYLIELLSRLGIRNICAVDGDVFDESNLNRQLLCVASNVGMSKVQAARARALAINPEMSFDAVEAMFCEENADALLEKCDIVLDALDSIETRRTLASAAARHNIPYIYGAIRGWVAQAAIVLPEDRLIDVLYPPEIRLTDKSVLAFTPALCAAIQIALCVKVLVGRPFSHGTLYYADLLSQEWETIPLS